jgi:spermidine synthase
MEATEHNQDKEIPLTIAVILAIILIEGFVTISVEMLTIRQLIAVVGNSVIITSLIIGIFLLFLALGYLRGGLYRENYSPVLINNFTYSSLLLGVGLSYLFIQTFFLVFFQHISNNALVVLVIYLLVIVSPLVYILGQTVPITTNLFRFEHHVGAISGKVLFISTIGSFLGSVFTTLVLMNFLGVAWTIFINFLLLLALIVLLTQDYRAEFSRLFFLMLASIIIFAVNVGVENKLFVKTNNYGDYQITPDSYYPSLGSGKLLSINNSASSFLSKNNKGFEYIELIKRILFHDLQLRNKDVLVLGAGGFTLSAEGNYGNRFLYVDIDGDLPEIVKKGFIDKIDGRFVADDARKFLMNTRQRFDVVVSDVYSNRHTIPFHLLTKEYFQSIKNVLQNSGIAIFNIIATPTLENAYSKRVDNTIRSVFSNCMIIPIEYIHSVTNIVYVCSIASPYSQDKTIYTDNLNSSMIDIFRQ